jgi:putative methionine-R-sulfoxide reductase with GAF domain
MAMETQTKKPQATRSLTATLAAAFLALSVAVLLTSSGLQIFSNVQTQQAIISSQQQLIAQGAAKAVSGFVQEKFSVLETAVKLASPATASSEQQKRVLDNLLGLQPAFRQLALLDTQDQESAKTSRISQSASGQLVDQLNGDVLDQIRQRKRTIGPIYIDPVTSEPLVIMAVPAINALGDFQGTLVAEVNLKFMWDLVDQLKVGETGVAYVVDRQGDLIAFGDTARVLKGENVKQLNEVSEFINNPTSADVTEANVYQGITGATVMGTYVPLGTPDWAVVTELPASEAYREVIRGAAISLAVTVVVAILAGLLGAYVARRLAAPLLNLTATATQIAGGEIGLQAAPEGPAEVASLAGAFNHMTEQLRGLISGLQARTRALETSAQVSRRLSTILDQQQLVAEVVEQLQKAFGYYHVHIYLVNETSQKLVMAGGTGEAGQTLLARGHRIPRGKGLVGRAAETGAAVLVPDVAQHEGWLPNPLLPDTRAEIAVPIMAGERVLGVLDVQHNVAGGLGQSDADLLQSIAGQVAIALQNTRLFAEAQRKAEREARLNLIAQRIQSTTTVEDALKVAVREAGQALGAQRVSVQLAPNADGKQPATQ